jgi:lipopolysaccharide export system protein LptA
MRTMVLGAGLLLLVALVVFLAIGKWKNPFNRHDIPKRLGIEIQQEANGVTYTQSHAGHTLFKIHASRVVELKHGNAQLHDVKIELYGEDGSRVDRIEGAEFEYDQKTGMATASGPVEITLMRPGVAPAVAPKAVVGEVVGSKLKGAPVASVAEAAARGEIHVKTSGLSFDQKSGVATTSQYVSFSMLQGSGSSMGATYESENGLLLLDRAVELRTQRGGDAIVIHAQHAEFERDSQLCRMRAASADYRNGRAEGGEATILFREDGAVNRLNVVNGLTLTTATGGRLQAPTGELEFDQHNQPHSGHLTGGVTMDSASDADGRRRQMHGSSPTADLEFTGTGKLHHAHLEQGVAIDSQEQNQQSDRALQLSRHWRSPVADIDFRTPSNGQVELDAVHGSGGVLVTGESQRDREAAVPFRLSADEVTGNFGASSALTLLTGVGHASIEETSATGSRQNTSGDRLQAHFAADMLASKQGLGNQAAIQSAWVEGHVVLTQTPAAKPGAAAVTMRATAGRADYQSSGEWLHLTSSPRVEDGALQFTADKVDVSRASGDAFAHGNVKASWMGAGDGRPGAPASGGVLGGQGPAHIVAQQGQLHQATGEAVFSGAARLWQQANSVSAPVIVLDRARQTLVAHTANASDPVRAVLVSTAGDLPGSAAGRSGQPAVIRVRGGELRYSDSEHKAVMQGGVLGTVVAELGSATVTSSEVEVMLQPAGKAADKNSGEAQVERMTARGHVVLTSEGRRGTGEQLVYTGATDEYLLTGSASLPPKITDPARGTVTGSALIFHGRDDSVSVEGGGKKTTTETTAPR